MTVTAINIVAAIFAGVAVILNQTNNLNLSIIFGTVSVGLFLLALFTIKSKNVFGKKKIKHLVAAIRKSTEAEYELHRNNVLADEFQEAVDKESSCGFNLPGGSLNSAIIDLYKKEFTIFTNILRNSINTATTNINAKGLHNHLSSLAVDMLNNHSVRIKKDYKRAADGYWGGKMGNLDLNEHFAKVADHETKLQIDKILSENNLNKTTT